MIVTCPHCQTGIEIDARTENALKGASYFDCPSCSGRVPVLFAASPMARAQRGMNRNLLILGSAALLVLGGLAFFIASRKGGDTYNAKQDISNEIIHNKFFTDLIASGATTAKDLETVMEIKSFGDGFIGISRDKVTWEEARELALNTGSDVLGMDDGDGRPLLEIAGDLTAAFSHKLGETVWVRQGNEPKMIDCPDVLSVTTLERRRHVFLHWYPDFQYLKNRNWLKIVTAEPQRRQTFDADQSEWLRLKVEYNNIGPDAARVFAFPYFKGENAKCDMYEGSPAYEIGSAIVDRGFAFSRSADVDEVRLEMISLKNKETVISKRGPLRANWKSSMEVELISVAKPAEFSPTKEITIPVEAGKKFTVKLTARYQAPVPTKLASNLLLREANILPPEFLAELQANHSATWHFDTESRPGYAAVNGSGTITFDLTGYSPREVGIHTFNLNLGLFDKVTWNTKVMKRYKVTLVATAAPIPAR